MAKNYKRKVYNIDPARIKKVELEAKKKKTNGSAIIRSKIDEL